MSGSLDKGQESGGKGILDWGCELEELMVVKRLSCWLWLHLTAIALGNGLAEALATMHSRTAICCFLSNTGGKLEDLVPRHSLILG
jgi:hypothetical protein